MWRRWLRCLLFCAALAGGLGAARADDGDDGGGGSAPAADSGGGGAAVGASSDGGGSGPGEPANPLFFRPRWPVEQFVADGLVALNPPSEALRLATSTFGAQVVATHVLAGLGFQLVQLRLFGIDAVTALEELSLRHPGVFALQHLYKPAQRAGKPVPPGGCTGVWCDFKTQMGWPLDSNSCGRQQRVGLVDTWVDTQLPGLALANMQTKSFLSDPQRPARDGHGTAVAGVLVGSQLEGYQGLLPQARLWVGMPFYALPSGRSAADVIGVVRALDWMLQSGVRVVGLALTGPSNGVLAQVVDRVQRRGVLLVAAAGNGGRLAPPAHPAALPGVLAVTAVARDNQAYRLANQGHYIGYAMPGVEVPILDADGGVRSSSGTSYAVPFLVAAVSQSLHERRLSPAQWQAGQEVPVRDLGVRGRDPVYGWGVPSLGWRCP